MSIVFHQINLSRLEFQYERNRRYTLSNANIFAHMNARSCFISVALLCKSLSTYGNIPTDSAKFNAQCPISINLPNNVKPFAL